MTSGWFTLAPLLPSCDDRREPTGFQGFRRCKTVLQNGFDWQHLYAMLIAYTCAATSTRDAVGLFLLPGHVQIPLVLITGLPFLPYAKMFVYERCQASIWLKMRKETVDPVLGVLNEAAHGATNSDLQLSSDSAFLLAEMDEPAQPAPEQTQGAAGRPESETMTCSLPWSG